MSPKAGAEPSVGASLLVKALGDQHAAGPDRRHLGPCHEPIKPAGQILLLSRPETDRNACACWHRTSLSLQVEIAAVRLSLTADTANTTLGNEIGPGTLRIRASMLAQAACHYSDGASSPVAIWPDLMGRQARKIEQVNG
jgi:hypothetical protein